MSSWKPISEEQLWDLLNEGSVKLSTPEARFFEAIRVLPHKWQLDPWGKQGDGFWVVGIIGQTVLWYNDIEEGFNHSKYSNFGTIDDYWCDQNNFEYALKFLKVFADTGIDNGKTGPPTPI